MNIKSQNLSGKFSPTKIFSFLLLIIFFYTVILRRPFFGIVADWHHQFLSSSSLQFAINWFREGILNLKFGMFEFPASIEFPTLAQRSLYISYPPGAVLPLFVISKILNTEPNGSILMAYNLMNHFLCAWILGFLALRISKKLWVSLFCAGSYLLWPSTLYWQQNVFFSDQAIILPFLIVWICEFDQSQKGKLLGALQFFAIFYGVLTDWFFVSVVIILLFHRYQKVKNLKRWIQENYPIVLTCLFAATLFLSQLYLLGGFEKIYQKFLDRTAMSEHGKTHASSFWKDFWLGYLGKQYGYASLLFFLTLIILAFKQLFKEKTIGYFSFISFSILLHTFLLRNHSAVHDFSVLKFAPLISLFPLVWYELKTKLSKKIFITGIVLFSLNLTYAHSRWHKMFVRPYSNYLPEMEMIKATSTFADMVFTPHTSIMSQPWRSMKLIRQISTLSDVGGLVPQARVNLLLIRLKSCEEFFDDFSNYCQSNGISFNENTRGSRVYIMTQEQFRELLKTEFRDRKICKIVTDDIY